MWDLQEVLITTSQTFSTVLGKMLLKSDNLKLLTVNQLRKCVEAFCEWFSRYVDKQYL